MIEIVTDRCVAEAFVAPRLPGLNTKKWSLLSRGRFGGLSLCRADI